MKKFLLSSFLLLIFACSVFAQKGTDIPTEVPLEEINEHGVIRCNSTPYNEYLRQKQPSRTSIDEFETWMAKEVKKFKEKGLERSEEVYTIPIIFHIVHHPQDLEPAEGSTNILAKYVDEQIRQLNDDMRQMGTVASPHERAADSHIEFCAALYDPEGNELSEPGINRINPATHNPPLGAGVYSIAEFDMVVKANTIWDPEQYCNFWSADLGGGVILGYAQFPQAPCVDGMPSGEQDETADGVVCLYNTIGGINEPAPNAPYDLGRTGTHEIGHWLGLRHIWGDGDCNADDFVSDTPNAGDSNGGCPDEFPNSCDDSGSDFFNGQDPPDMMNNFMDYSADRCFDLFTVDQRTRMRIVMGDPDEACSGSPRRENLKNSLKCTPLAPFIAFDVVNSTTKEETGCEPSEFKSVQVDLRIAQAPMNEATVQINVNADNSTAVEGIDFVIPNNTVTFPVGVSDNQSVTIDIIRDAFEEGEETLELSFTITSGDDAQPSTVNTTHTLTIEDDDLTPDLASLLGVTVLEETFDDPLPGWNTTDLVTGGNEWIVSSLADLGNPSAHISPKEGVFAGMFNYDGASPTTSIYYHEVDATDLREMNISFNWQCVGETEGGEDANSILDYGALVYSTDGAATFRQVPNSRLFHTQSTVTNYSLSLVESLEGQVLQLGFMWHNDPLVGTTPFAVDDIMITAKQRVAADIEMNMDSDEQYVGANQTTYFYGADGDVIAQIDNGSLPLGCTTVSVLTDGNGDNVPVSGIDTDAELASKTFEITPSMNDQTADYTVWLYYTQAEIDQWINSHSMSVTVDDFKILKTSNSDIGSAGTGDSDSSPSVKVAYQGTNNGGFRFHGSFTGFSKFGGGNVPALSLPVELVEFSGTAQDETVVLNWYVGNEVDLTLYEVQKQNANGIFKTIGQVNASGKSTYSFTDNHPAEGNNYYRLKLIDDNARFSFSKVVNITFTEKVIVKNIYPNPAQNTVFVELDNSINDVEIRVHNHLGQLMNVPIVNTGNNIQLQTADLAMGTYFIEIISEKVSVLERVVISR